MEYYSLATKWVFLFFLSQTSFLCLFNLLSLVLPYIAYNVWNENNFAKMLLTK